jgi:3-hydroxybutyryl-CoA dehydrogenase
MEILVVGESDRLEELRAKFGSQHHYTLALDHFEAERLIDNFHLIFDFIIDEEPDEFEIYASRKITVFFNTAKMSLSQLVYLSGTEPKCMIFGFNGLPTFVNRGILEASIFNGSSDELSKVCKDLGTEVLIVDDRVGLVTPRVICMIINEAYYTVQEGTASREDIDLAMKLGTNYPFGPFEWCKRIGIRHVYELLEAVYEDTKDERYKIAPLLKKEYLRAI